MAYGRPLSRAEYAWSRGGGGELMKRISPEIDFKAFADGASRTRRRAAAALRPTNDAEKACTATVRRRRE